MNKCHIKSLTWLVLAWMLGKQSRVKRVVRFRLSIEDEDIGVNVKIWWRSLLLMRVLERKLMIGRMIGRWIRWCGEGVLG